ncbi:radical SAM protein [Candidatus Soleaferrea massiliensis]|uniref:radical SAM protein n=1 Tax=Candidatus Soleaferrea massiliensis TaxID=1470354 RepID=UPI00058C6CF4|nr:radical SAM protein [Candidatus Soleaferrea massiliensis]
MDNSTLTSYMNQAIEQIVSDVLKNTLSNPRETAFLLQFRRHSRKASARRAQLQREGLHVPAFLISSITHACNLHCHGCYARANGTCQEHPSREPLRAGEWERIFSQASELGVGFHLLAGGEPLLRQDVLEKAAQHPETVFPVFTNGTMLSGGLLDLFEQHRNLIPILSLEGGAAQTDARRGAGTYERLQASMRRMHARGILYGVSITVTIRNLDAVTDPSFFVQLKALGCRAALFIEYVPVDEATRPLAFTELERTQLNIRQEMLRKAFPSVLFLSFPGDEAQMGGCLAAGRGFFHIGPYGDAEACPFAPYSDLSLRDRTLLEALRSPFFGRLREANLASEAHLGGCALFEQKERVEAILSQKS